MSLLIVLSFALLQSPVPPAGAAVSGQVVEDGSGTPIAGAQITFIPNRPSPGPRPFQDRELMTTTDQDGRYEMTGLDAGRYRINVQKPGFASVSFLGMPEVVLAAGERRETVTVTLAKGAVIAGRVLDEAGEPLTDARVMALRKPTVPPGAPPMRGDVLIPGGPGTQTNDLGEFRLFSLAPGEYFVQASPQDRFSRSSAPRARTLLPTYFPGTLEAASATPISLDAGQTVNDVEIRMLGAAAFQISGLVLDEAGRPVVNALVRLVADEATGRPSNFMRPWQDSRTDASGKFLITSVTNGSYTLLAIAPVVIATPADQRRPAGAGDHMSFGSISSSVSGTIGGGITTETRDGTTIQYRDDAGTRVPVTVSDVNIGGLQVIVRPPPR